MKKEVESIIGGGERMFSYVTHAYAKSSDLLSCFHGPHVESSFNVMSDIIDKKSGKIKIETYNAIQNIKFGLRASDKSAVQYFGKNDFLHGGVKSGLDQEYEVRVQNEPGRTRSQTTTQRRKQN